MKDKYNILVVEEGKAMHNSMHGLARFAAIEKVARKFQASLLSH